MRIVAAMVVASAIALGGCGSSGTPKSTEAFCARLADLRQRNPITDAASSDQAADEVASILDDLVEISPQQIKGDLRTFRRLIDEIRKVDSTDPVEAEAALRELATPGVIQSADTLAEFARDQCGFEDVFQADGA
jgi:hypothetical protein